MASLVPALALMKYTYTLLEREISLLLQILSCDVQGQKGKVGFWWNHPENIHFILRFGWEGVGKPLWLWAGGIYYPWHMTEG